MELCVFLIPDVVPFLLTMFRPGMPTVVAVLTLAVGKYDLYRICHLAKNVRKMSKDKVLKNILMSAVDMWRSKIFHD